MNRLGIYEQVFRILVSFAVLSALYLAIALKVLLPEILFALISICFALLTWFEFKLSKFPFFSLPPSYYSLTMSFYIFLSGFLYFGLEQSDTTQFYVADEYIVLGAWYTLASVQILWIGFYLMPTYSNNFFGSLGFKSAPIWVINIFVAIFLMSLLIGVYTGNFGYVADQEDLAGANFVRFGLSCGLVAIILATIYHYDSKDGRRYLYFLIATNMFVGVLFGSKSTAVQPVFLLILTNYLCGRKLEVRWLLAAVLVIALAYILIEPFRIYYEVTGGDTLTLSGLINLFFAARTVTEGNEVNYIESFFTRISYVTAVGKAIEFADITGYYRSQEWIDVMYAPLYGAVPRVIWESKPLADFGLWASANIFDLPETTHTGILPAAYSYLVFRLPGIATFFILYGLIQRLGFNLFFITKGLLPVYIYFYIIVLYPSYPVWTSVSTFTQTLILTTFILFVLALFQKKNYRVK